MHDTHHPVHDTDEPREPQDSADPLETGLFLLPPALALMIGAITAGRLVGRIGTRPVAVVGLVLGAIGNRLLFN